MSWLNRSSFQEIGVPFDALIANLISHLMMLKVYAPELANLKLESCKSVTKLSKQMERLFHVEQLG